MLSNTPNRDRLGVHYSHSVPRFERMDFLLVTFFFDVGLGFALPFFCFTLTFFFFGFRFRFDYFFCFFSGIFRRLLLASNSLSKKLILLCLKYRDSGNIITLKYDQIGDPKRSFSNFLKYGGNKENDTFSIDNTIVLKKNVHNSCCHQCRIFTSLI